MEASSVVIIKSCFLELVFDSKKTLFEYVNCQKHFEDMRIAYRYEVKQVYKDKYRKNPNITNTHTKTVLIIQYLRMNYINF